MGRGAVLNLLLALWLVGCGGSAPPRQVASLVLGTTPDGQGEFLPLVDGQEVSLVEGAQGGFHVWLRYRYDGAPGQRAQLLRTAHRVSDEAIVLRTVAQVTVEAESEPLAMFMCPSPIGLSVIDQPIRFELHLSGDDGEDFAAQGITLVPRCPAGREDFCMRICTG